MALSKKPINPDDPDFVKPVIQSANSVPESKPATNLPVEQKNPNIPPSKPFIPQKSPTPQFKPQERKGILEINEGVEIYKDNIHDKKEVKDVKPKRQRLSTGHMTAQDMLTKDYETTYAHITDKVNEVTQWTQKILTDNNKNEDVSAARRERGEAYEDMASFIDNLLLRHFANDNVVSPRVQGDVIQAVINEILGLGPIEPLWQDSRISEIMVNGPYEVKVEIGGQIVDAPGSQFRNAEHLLQVCQQILGDTGRRVDVQKPLADGSLADGSRINVVHNVVAPKGPYLTVRRFPDTVFTIRELIQRESMTEEMALEIGNLVYKGCSTIVSGSTGTGKTSMLNALSGAIPMGDRVITIEDTLELRLNPKKHVLSMVTKDAAANGEGAVKIRDLVKNALRQRPDRIVVGEIRDEAALDMITALTTGHDGSLTTVHANDAAGAIIRVAQLIGQGGELTLEKSLPMIAGGLDLVVAIERYEDGSRRVAAISEVPDFVENGTLTPILLWEFVQDGTKDGKIFGHYEKFNEISASLDKKHRLSKKQSLTLDELYEISDVPQPKIEE